MLAALRSAGERGLCISDMERIDRTAVLTMRNRLSELRASGVAIESERCQIHKHRSSVARYRLVPPKPHQYELPVFTNVGGPRVEVAEIR